MGVHVEIVGLEKLEVKLKKAQDLQAVKRVVKQNGVEMQAKTVRNAVFGRYTKHSPPYTKGDTKRSITGRSEDGGMTYREGPTTAYSGYVEKGTRKMTAQPFVKPAFNTQKQIFKSDMKKLVK